MGKNVIHWMINNVSLDTEYVQQEPAGVSIMQKPLQRRKERYLTLFPITYFACEFLGGDMGCCGKDTCGRRSPKHEEETSAGEVTP